MTLIRSTGFAVTCSLVILLGVGIASADQPNTEVGLLKCFVSGGSGFIFGSTKELECKFEAADGRREAYRGEISKYGIDIGGTGKGVMYWTVLAPTGVLGDRALMGAYAGVTAGAAVGVGGSANALLGGSDKTVTLQPLSGEVETGLNLAVGIAEMELH